MSKLSTSQRAALPKSTFAGPGRSFPINDRKHAKAAIMDTSASVRAGHISVGQADKIKERARAFLRSH